MQLVDVYHTNAGVLGANVQTGTIDVWLNGIKSPGMDQPGCIGVESPICSHSRSWMYFAESVDATMKKFYAKKCASFGNFKNNTCYQNEPIQAVGIDINTKLSGNYYLQTNDKYPFARDIAGSMYNSSQVKDEETTEI